MRVRLQILARWYEARANRAQMKANELRAKAEEFFRRLSEGGK